MATEEVRRPIYANRVDAISWKQHGKRVLVDPLLRPLFNRSVYRYATIAEALALCEGKMGFATPRQWPDKYESHSMDQLFAEGGPFEDATPFVKCFSLEYSSEAMWRTYCGPGGVVRAGMKLKDLIDGLDNAKWPFDATLYIGRVRYMDPTRIRKSIQSLRMLRPDPTMDNAMPALLMKRSGHSFENEVRVAFFPTSKKGPAETIIANDFPVGAVNRMLLDPYLPEWQTDELRSLFLDKLGAPFKVRRSSFNAHPLDLEVGQAAK